MSTTDTTATPRDLPFAASVLRQGQDDRAELIRLTDEEMAVLQDIVGGPSTWSPWAQEHPDQLDAAKDSVRRGLMVRNTLVPEAIAAEREEREIQGDRDRLVPEPLVAGVMLLRRSAQLLTVVERTTTLVDTPYQDVRYYYHQEPGIALEEAVNPEGVHTFASLPTASIGGVLARLADPTGVAAEDGEQRMIPLLDDGSLPMDDGIIRDTRIFLRATTSGPGGDLLRTINVHVTSTGVHVSEPTLGEDDELTGARAAEVSGEGLRTALSWVVTDETP